MMSASGTKGFAPAEALDAMNILTINLALSLFDWS